MKDSLVVLIPDRLPPPADVEQEVFGDGVQILTPCALHSSEISNEVWSSVDAILIWHDLQLTADVIAKLERCRVIVRVGVGFDNVDLEAAGKQAIPVCNVPDYGTADVADHAIALMLSLTRGINAFSEQVLASNDNWHWNAAGILYRLANATMGIIGLGRIGTATALRAKAFGMRVTFYDPYIPDGQDKALGITRCHELGDLLSQANVISIHTPLTSETRGMVNAAFLSQLKQGAIFINTARGPIIDLDALTEALRSGRLHAAGLDVLPQEPPDPEYPLFRAWRTREPWIAHRLIITPHAAFYCEEAYREMREKAALEAKRVLEGKKPHNCINEVWLSGRHSQ